MRNTQTAIVAAATALTLLGYGEFVESRSQESAPKLGYINSSEVLQEVPGAREVQTTFEREMAQWRGEVQALADTLQQMVSDYEQQQVMLSPERREERQREIQAKQVEYNQRAAELQEQAQERYQELVQPIYDRISRVLGDIRDEQRYAMIFDADAPGGGLIAADTTLNITDQVIERLRAGEGGEEGEQD